MAGSKAGLRACAVCISYINIDLLEELILQRSEKHGIKIIACFVVIHLSGFITCVPCGRLGEEFYNNIVYKVFLIAVFHTKLCSIVKDAVKVKVKRQA